MKLKDLIKKTIFFEDDKSFFDKQATIKEYLAIVPPEHRVKTDSYDELYAEALKYVGKQDFMENTKELDDYFYLLGKTDGAVAVLTGAFAYAIAYQIDKNRKKLENGVDKILSNNGQKGYDVNNPFDTRIGKNHRDFGHDVASFGFKTIPNDTLVADRRNGQIVFKTVGEMLGKSGNISMMDIIWEYYGKTCKTKLGGIFNCLGHTLVHFTKDLFTSEGLPLPFSSLLNQYVHVDNGKYCGLLVQQSINPITNPLNRAVDKVKGNLKMADFASLGFIEGMCKIYCESKNLGDKEDSFKREMKVIAMGTCIILQLSSMIVGGEIQMQQVKRGAKPMIPGAKLNLVMTTVMFKYMVKELTSISKARHEVNLIYENGGRIYE